MYADELAATLDDMGVEYAVFQLEEGELGTPHYQGTSFSAEGTIHRI